jgi:hypothetical protein
VTATVPEITEEQIEHACRNVSRTRTTLAVVALTAAARGRIHQGPGTVQ